MNGKQSSFEIWENIILTGNTEELKNILNEDVIFYSPVVFKPQKGKVLVMKYYQNPFQECFECFFL